MDFEIFILSLSRLWCQLKGNVSSFWKYSEAQMLEDKPTYLNNHNNNKPCMREAEEFGYDVPDNWGSMHNVRKCPICQEYNKKYGKSIRERPFLTQSTPSPRPINTKKKW